MYRILCYIIQYFIISLFFNICTIHAIINFNWYFISKHINKNIITYYVYIYILETDL